MIAAGEVQLRPMTGADVAAVLALERRCEGAPRWSAADYLGCVEDAAGEGLRRFALVAAIGAELAGFAVVRLLSSTQDWEAELESIAVAPEWRGRGIGALLLASALESTREEGARRMDLEVRCSNRAALGLYSRAGFQEVGRRRGYYRQPDEDAVLMSITG